MRIEKFASEHDHEFVEFVLSQHWPDGRAVEIEEHVWTSMLEMWPFNPRKAPGKYQGCCGEKNETRLKEAIQNAEKNYRINRAICEKCDEWRAEAWFGYGGCAQCGCSALKLLTPGQACPLNKWSNAT